MDRRHPGPVRDRRPREAHRESRDRRAGRRGRIQAPLTGAAPGTAARPASQILFRWIAEDLPSDQWVALFARAWPSYRRWFALDGEAARPSLLECRRALAEHMPELLPTWERLVDLAGGDETAARMLALYRPAPFLAGCSQAVWTHDTPVLVRNYDYRPEAFEGSFLLSRWHDTRVLASSDCLWGVLDGVNEHGLAVALAFAGSREVGDGFGIPLLLRYVLELCRTVDEAAEVLRRVPSHMAYNVSLVDRQGSYAVAHVGPGRETVVVREAVCTNHRAEGTWSAYARATRSHERERYLLNKVGAVELGADGLTDLFLGPPLRMTDYAAGYGTLYTVAYRPATGAAEFRWPSVRVAQSIDRFEERELLLGFTDA